MSLQYSSKLGITTEHLLEVNKGSLDVLPEIDCVTNQLILDFYDFKERNSTCTYQTVCKWLPQFYKSHWPDRGTPTPQQLHVFENSNYSLVDGFQRPN